MSHHYSNHNRPGGGGRGYQQQYPQQHQRIPPRYGMPQPSHQQDSRNRTLMYGADANNNDTNNETTNIDIDQQSSNATRSQGGPRMRSVVVPSSYEVPIWATWHVNAARYNIGARSGTAIVCILFVIFLWLTLWVPSWPTDWYRYCAMYYVLQLPFYITNLFFPLNIMVNTMYGIYALINTLLFGFQCFLMFLFGYNYYNCWVGNLPYSCTDNYWIDLIMLTLTFILWVVGLLTMVYFWSVTVRTSATSKPSLIEYTAMN